MVLPVVCSNRKGGGERSIRLRERACVGEAVPQTITEGVTAPVLLAATVGVPIYMIEGFALGQSSVPSTLHRTLRNRWKEIGR